MKLTKMLLAAGAAGLMGAAVPAPAQATWWCWFGKCDTGSSSGGSASSSGGTSSSGGGSSGGDPTPVPEPEQMALFAMGSAVLAGRVLFARRKKN